MANFSLSSIAFLVLFVVATPALRVKEQSKAEKPFLHAAVQALAKAVQPAAHAVEDALDATAVAAHNTPDEELLGVPTDCKKCVPVLEKCKEVKECGETLKCAVEAKGLQDMKCDTKSRPANVEGAKPENIQCEIACKNYDPNAPCTNLMNHECFQARKGEVVKEGEKLAKDKKKKDSEGTDVLSNDREENKKAKQAKRRTSRAKESDDAEMKRLEDEVNADPMVYAMVDLADKNFDRFTEQRA